MEKHFGMIREGATQHHSETMPKRIAQATATCNCINLTFRGQELSFTLVVPRFAKDVLGGFTKQELSAGFESHRAINLRYEDGTEDQLLIHFTTYLPA